MSYSALRCKTIRPFCRRFVHGCERGPVAATDGEIMRVWFRVLILCGIVSCASAQETMTSGSVAGWVVDSSGAAVPHVAVTAVQVETNQLYRAETDALGR